MGDLVGEANSALDAGSNDRAAALGRTIVALAGAMGLTVQGTDTDGIDDEVRSLARDRDDARAARDFNRADALRDELQARGWIVEDTAEGTALHR